MAKPPSNPRTVAKTPARRGAVKPASAKGKKAPLTAAAIVKAQMPGWQVAKAVGPVVRFSRMSDMKSDSGPSLEQLRRKFYGPQVADAPAPALGEVDESIQTIRVRPKDGGPAKTADIRNGKISIVQG